MAKDKLEQIFPIWYDLSGEEQPPPPPPAPPPSFPRGACYNRVQVSTQIAVRPLISALPVSGPETKRKQREQRCNTRAYVGHSRLRETDVMISVTKPTSENGHLPPALCSASGTILVHVCGVGREPLFGVRSALQTQQRDRSRVRVDPGDVRLFSRCIPD